MKVLVLGSGAREHALVRSLSADPAVDAVIAAPGNPGIAALALCRDIEGGPTSPKGVVALATELGVDLVVVGPEAPLVAGVTDALVAEGIACFGPTAEAARLEGSKSFAKDVMSAAEVPTGLAHVCSTLAEVEDAFDAFGAPHVVKEDGLAAGKGVVVTSERQVALDHAAACLAKPDGRVVIEEFLDGPEVSLFCLVDGATVVPLLPAQDFKRVGDWDTGPNTGGMGAYAPLPWLPDEVTAAIVRDVVAPVAAEMVKRGCPFSGLLYAGLAITSQGPAVVEFNCRFGDPETQAVLALLESPLGQLLYATATGTLGDAPPLRWRKGYAVTVVVAAENYPGSPRTGDAITGAEAYGVLHAGTARRDDGAVVSAGGRVLSVVGRGSDLTAARADAYQKISSIRLPGGHFRVDIGLAAAEGRITL